MLSIYRKSYSCYTHNFMTFFSWKTGWFFWGEGGGLGFFCGIKNGVLHSLHNWLHFVPLCILAGSIREMESFRQYCLWWRKQKTRLLICLRSAWYYGAKRQLYSAWRMKDLEPDFLVINQYIIYFHINLPTRLILNWELNYKKYQIRGWKFK